MNNDVFISGVKEKFPAELLDGRVNVEANVIGCMISDMFLAEDTNIDGSKFITKNARLIFGIIKTLREKKCTVFDEQGRYLNKAYKDYPVRRNVSGHEVDVSTIMDGVY